MILAIGAKVKLRYSGESGTICAMLDEGMLMVRLDDNPDMEIPVFVEDVVRNADAERETRGARFVSVPDKPPAAPPRREIKGQYRILKPRGLQLCFEPEKDADGIASRYKIWLLNDSPNEYLYEIDIYTRSQDVLYEEGKLGGETLVELGVLTLSQLNDHPEVWMEACRISTEGIEAPQEAFFKIKVKNFFKRFVTAPILNAQAYCLDLQLAPPPSAEKKNTLSEYTRQQLRASGRQKTNRANTQPYDLYDSEAFAHFENEVDLHAEKILPNYSRLDKGEILRLQLLHFHRFMDKAIRLGVSRVFVIHGVGEGKLRDAVAAALRAMPHVRKFKNQYHHKYGYGATEVWLDD
ncbi:MAG: Smr/MutS family protein [Saprospiraceae bacterium]